MHFLGYVSKLNSKLRIIEIGNSISRRKNDMNINSFHVLAKAS